MTADLKVVPLFDQAMAADVVGPLRRAADSIESETYMDDRTVAMIAVHVTESGEVEVYGWDATDRFHMLGALVKALAKHA